MIPFNYQQFVIDYPQFGTLSENAVTNTFTYQACVTGQRVSVLFDDDNAKYYWLTIVLAHILTCQQTGLLGAVSGATQGSNTVSFQLPPVGTDAWWNITTYGQSVLQVIKTYGTQFGYVSDGQSPYLSESMSGAGSGAFVI